MQTTSTAAIIPGSAAAIEQTGEYLLARRDALFAAAQARDVGVSGFNALVALRDAVEWLDFASEGIARGLPFDSPEIVDTFCPHSRERLSRPRPCLNGWCRDGGALVACAVI